MAIAVAVFLVSLDSFIVNVAITTISGELGVPEDIGTWVITLFSIASTVCVPLAGSLSIRYGNFRLFMCGVLIFALASLVSGLASTFPMLLIGRVFQGAAAGILTPVALALIISNFPPEKRSVALGYWSFFVFVGPAMGPMIGGWLSDYRWHWMFYLNIPFCMFSLLTVWLFLKGKKEKTESLPVDFIGILLLFTSMGALQTALNRWNIDDWFRSPFIVALFIIAAICLIFLIVWEVFHPSPFIKLALFKNRNFTLSSLTTAIGIGVIFSSFVLDSLWVQDVLAYTPFWAGLTLTPVGLFPLMCYPIMGRFVRFLDLRIWVILSFLIYAATFLWLSYGITLYTEFWQLALPRLVQGIGFAIFTIPNAFLIVRGVAPEKLTTVVSLFSFCRLLAVAVGVALAITLWIFRTAFYQTRLIERTFVNNPLLAELKAPFEQVTNSEPQSTALAYNALVNDASTLALADIYYLFSWIFIALCFVVLFYKPPVESKGH
jgi:MFS transporter, DHA2 family, multidrug resistance protein